MGECPATQVARHLLLGLHGFRVSLSTVALQRPRCGQHLGAQRALVLELLGQGAALGVCQHTTLEGKALLTPATGVGLGAGGGLRRHGFVFSLPSFLLISVFFLFPLLFFVGTVICGTGGLKLLPLLLCL